MMQRLLDWLRKHKTEAWFILGGVGVLACYAGMEWILLTSTQLAPVHGVVPENGIYVRLLGVPLDDVYIHCRYASNLLHGYSYSLNPGETLTADTSPLWVLMLALAGLMTTHLELATVVLSILCYLLLAPLVYRICKDVFALTESNARLAGWCTVFAGRLAWSGMSGMETALAVLLLLLAFREHALSMKRGALGTHEGILLGLGLLARPEFVFFAGLLFADWVYAAYRRRVVITNASATLLVFCIVASPAILLPLITRNSLVAHSSVVQGAGMHWIPDFEYLFSTVKVMASSNLLLFVLALVAIVLIWKEPFAPLLLALAFGLPLLQAFVAPQGRHHLRYLFPILPLLIIIGVLMWQRMLELRSLKGWMQRVIPILIILGGVLETGRWAYLTASDVRNINDEHLAIAHWLNANLHPTDTLAIDDAGAAAYLTNRRLIDLTGLMTPAIFRVEDNQDSVWRVARTMGANMFVICELYHPSFYIGHKDSLDLVKEFQVRLPLTSAFSQMGIYRVKETQHGS